MGRTAEGVQWFRKRNPTSPRGPRPFHARRRDAPTTVATTREVGDPQVVLDACATRSRARGEGRGRDDASLRLCTARTCVPPCRFVRRSRDVIGAVAGNRSGVACGVRDRAVRDSHAWRKHTHTVAKPIVLCEPPKRRWRERVSARLGMLAVRAVSLGASSSANEGPRIPKCDRGGSGGTVPTRAANGTQDARAPCLPRARRTGAARRTMTRPTSASSARRIGYSSRSARRSARPRWRRSSPDEVLRVRP